MFAASKTASVSGGYQISRSLRFNSADSAYLIRTPATATNRKTWTWSGWVKRSKLGTRQQIFNARPGASEVIEFFTNDTIGAFDYSGGVVYQLTPSAVFRDPSAWYHIVWMKDTTQATEANRMKIWVNNTQLTTFSTAIYPSQNSESYINSVVNHHLGTTETTDLFLDGYMTEVNFIDGQALTPSSFGETNAQTGVWQPKAYSGSYGTNGFYLNFSDNSNTTAATLGKDYSGNGNNWTPNNFSVTAGSGNDSLVDSPTSYGTDTGVGGTVRGNYATWNPLDKFTATTALSNGNLDFVLNTGAQPDETNAVATMALSSGKWYWEGVWTSAVDSAPIFGVWDTISTTPVRNRGTSYFYGYLPNGNKYNSGTQTSYGTSWTTNDVIGVALDMDAGTLTFYKNGVSQGTAFSSLSGKTLLPIVVTTTGSTNATSTGTGNFGQRPFAYTAPSGYKALCTQNLPTPTIGATTATQANKYFDVVLRNGKSGPYSTNVNMANGALLWDKPRSATAVNALVDSVRGISKYLVSSGTDAEATDVNWFTNFGTNSFSTGSSDWGTGTTVVDWIWAANGSGSTNTAGSITSTVSANTTSGFSVVTFTGTNGTQTIGHGLGVAPSMIITKCRNAAGEGWWTYHASLGYTQYLALNSTNAATTLSWGGAPTSTVFYNAGGSFMTNGNTYVAYCFAEVAGYSKFGSYTGNGSADGPFVFTGFKPAFFMLKRTDSGSTNSWIIIDATRNPYNFVDKELSPNTSDPEGTGGSTYSEDFLSNGVKIRNTGGGTNANGGTYIYAAFASNPLKYSLAR